MARSDDSGSTVELASLGKKYALVVGVNEAAKEHHLAPLEYAETDAQKIYLHLHQVCNFAFPPQSYLVGDAATTQKVQAAAASLISHSTTEDLLLFYFITFLKVINF